MISQFEDMIRTQFGVHGLMLVPGPSARFTVHDVV